MFRKHSPGLTLAEVLIVMAVLGILLAMGVPSISKVTAAYRIKEASREIASDLQFARMLAIKENQTSTVTFTTTWYQVLRSGTLIKNRDLTADYQGYDLWEGTIVFDSRGMATTSGTITVAGHELVKNIEVASSGKVKIQ
jgi:prepilin-type N-terminal cleavage/methylation domain-containing protein